MGNEKPWQTDPKKVQNWGENASKDGVTNATGSHGDDPKPVARFVLDKYSCPKFTPIVLVPIQPVKFFIDFMLAIRLGDMGCDDGGMDPVMEGAKYFTVCGLPLARKDDGLQHGGTILTGSPNFQVGGPKFSLPKNITVLGGYDHMNKIVRDLYFLSTTKTGSEILDRIDKHGKPVKIYSSDDNSSDPTDRDAGLGGSGSGTDIKYNPDADNIYTVDEHGNKMTTPPQVSLGHELCHAVHFGEGKGSTAHSTEEANTVGYDPRTLGGGLPGRGKKKGPQGPYKFPGPTENDLRKDLNLPRRGTYEGGKWDQQAKNLRPGSCQ